ncbi:MAG TPA: hypothetical protein VKP11_02330 [Frankiaceae bacterium]|nr:hypothetical protein [Frankiaceae bacterium]
MGVLVAALVAALLASGCGSAERTAKATADCTALARDLAATRVNAPSAEQLEQQVRRLDDRIGTCQPQRDTL